MESRFPQDIVSAANHGAVIGVRVGNTGHRFTAVWPVVVGGRIFARSWSLKPGGWRDAASRDRHAMVQVGGVDLPARMILRRSESVNGAVDAAYRAKYRTEASAKYVSDLTSGESRLSTVEFVPAEG